MGSKGDPKNHTKKDKGRIFGGPGGELKMELRPGLQKVRFCCYLLHLSQVGRVQKRPSLGTVLGTRLVKNTKKGGSKKNTKNTSKKDTTMGTKIEQFGNYFETHFKTIRNLGSLAPPWISLAPFWGHFGVILWLF